MTNLELKAFCESVVGKPVMYMWGTYGNLITEDLIKRKSTQSASYATHYDAAYQKQLRELIGTGIGCDCTGLIKWFLWTGGDIEAAPKYDAKTDNSASAWFNAAYKDKRGEIGTIPLDRVGLIVSKEGHCGVYVGNGEVIECTKGTLNGIYLNGVVKTKLTDRAWEKWCECIYITYETEEAVNEISHRTARVSKDCLAYSTINKREIIGNVFTEDEVMYLGDVGKMAAVIYPTSATAKIGFVEKAMIVV